MMAELREAVRAREDFIALAAHELRNPITPIQLSVRLLENAHQCGDSAKVDLELQRLKRLLNHFVRRTEMLLDVTQLISGKLRLQPALTPLAEVARGVLDALDPLLVRSGSELIADLSEPLEAMVDPVAFGQICENLLSNAIKYGMGRRIEMELRSGESKVSLIVRDHGAGIDAADLARIFEPFERAVKRNSHPGFGLGLWVTRRLAEAMDGSITVSSKKGAGSVFTVTLPLDPRNSDE